MDKLPLLKRVKYSSLLRTIRRNSFTSFLSLAVLLGSLIAGVSYVKNQQEIGRSRALTGGPTLYFQPASKSVASGATGQLYDIYINTNGFNVTAASIELSFNSSYITVTSIAAGTALSQKLSSSVSTSTAKIDVGSGTVPFNGTGKVATITFNAKAVNTSTSVVFTTNTMVAAVGYTSNVLGVVTNGTLTIGSTLTPTRAVTNTPTPTITVATPTLTPIPTAKASLYFSPSSKTVAAGSTGQLYDIYLNTNGLSVSAASIEVSFDANYIVATGFNAGTALPTKLSSSVAPTTAKIDVGSGPTTPFNGTGKVATLVFNSKGTPTLNTAINFTQNTVVAAVGMTGNVAGTMTKGTVVVTGINTPTPTVPVTLTPTPTRAITPTPPPTGPGNTTVTTFADTYVSSAYPNHISGDEIRVVASDFGGNNRYAYLKFHIGSVTPKSAVLKLKVSLERAFEKRVYVTSTSWAEDTLTYNIRPAFKYQIGYYNHLSSMAPVGETISIPLDATKLVPNANGNVSIAIGNTGNGYSLNFYSKESGNTPAQLVIDTVIQVTPTPVITNTPTPTARPTNTPTPTFRPTNTPTPTIAQWSPTPTFPPTNGVVYEAEYALLQSAAVLTSHTGYSGTGYVDFVLNSGSRIVWYNVNNPAAGSKTIGFRYSLGGFSSERTVSLLINGRYLGDISFANTGDWSKWQTKNLNVNLAGGTNVIELVTVGYDGPDIDYLQVNTGAQPTISIIPATFTPTPWATKTPTPLPTNGGPTFTPTPTKTVTNTPIPSTSLSATPDPSEIGDADQDGDVDEDDYAILSGYLTTSNNSGPADFNNDGVIDGVDYIIWLITYGI